MGEVLCQGGKHPSCRDCQRAFCSILFFRSIQPEDKSFAVGMQFMLLRVLGKLKCVKIPSWKIMASLGEGFPRAGKDAALQGQGALEGMRQGSSKAPSPVPGAMFVGWLWPLGPWFGLLSLRPVFGMAVGPGAVVFRLWVPGPCFWGGCDPRGCGSACGPWSLFSGWLWLLRPYFWGCLWPLRPVFRVAVASAAVVRPVALGA